MTPSVYDQHKAHTSRVGAFCVLLDGEHVASITIRFPKDGASRLYAYVHWIGTTMQRGHANGYGYDKRTAAMADAARKYLKVWDKALEDHGQENRKIHVKQCMFWEYLADDRTGKDWSDKLRDAGFTVVCVC